MHSVLYVANYYYSHLLKVLIVFLCRKFSHREPSATEMLNSVKVLNKVITKQLVCI